MRRPRFEREANFTPERLISRGGEKINAKGVRHVSLLDA
jgi:hypothetical protein